MIADATTVDRNAFARTFDLCVIGAGPAGITIARTVAATGARVALMEAGGMEISEESQDVYRGTNLGLDYFEMDTARLRYFGGTSNHWAGWCRALDPYDFTPKPYMDLSGWPIGRIDLDPYRARADAILDIPSETEVPDLPFRQREYNFRRFQFRWSPPTRFATKYGAEIAAAPLIELYLNANLVDLQLAPDLATVDGALFRSYDPADPGFTVKARAYALCTGGVENARLLLNFTRQIPEGIGNRTGMVGRCFCDHPHFILADVAFRVLLSQTEFYSPFETFMQEHEVLNFGLRMQPNDIEPGAMDALTLRDLTEEEFAIHLRKRVHDPVSDLAPMRRTPLPGRQEGVLRMAQEQAQNPDSRVRLGEERDAFGLRRVAMDWRMTELDVHTMRTAVMSFAEHMADQNIGRARIRPWLVEDPVTFPGVLEDEVGGKHHMSTTRMAADPRRGVVDADCLVHGTSNLFVGGSSVFASTGHCNPTYTITQLALRLGDHLETWLQS